MVRLDEALLVLKGWEDRRLWIKFDGTASAVNRLEAKCELFAVFEGGASFFLGEDFAVAFDLRSCGIEYGEPPKEAGGSEVESVLVFAEASFTLALMLLKD
jgi:hypothetical protein